MIRHDGTHYLPRESRHVQPVSLTRRLLELLAWLATVAMVAVLLPAPDDDAARRAQRAEAATNPVTPGNFRGFGFDQCLTPTQGAMNTWLNHSPFLAVGIYISGDSRACRNQPNLTVEVGQHPAQQGLATAADHARTRRRPASRAFPRYQRRLQDQPEARAEQRLQHRQGPGHHRGRPVGGRGAGARHRAGLDALVRPRRLQPRRHPVPRVGPPVPERLGDPGAHARLQGRRLLERRLRHQDARRRAGQPTRQVRAARRHLDRALGRHRQHQHHLPPRGRLAARRPREAVHGRPRRDLGRRPDQHRQQLPRGRQGVGRRTPRPAAAGSGSASLATTPSAPRPSPARPRRSTR